MAHVQLPPVDDNISKSLEMSSAEIIRARRACTVPQQLSRSYQLPSLSNSLPVPRRYEETKPVIVQNMTHRRIIDLGEFISMKSREDAEKQRAAAVEKAIADTWETAEGIKEEAIKTAIENTQTKHEKQTKRLMKQHDKAIKEEAMRIENMMQNKMREALEEERTLAEKALNEAVLQTKQRCALELKEAVVKARNEEQAESAKQKTALLQYAANTLEATKQKLLKEKEEALETLNILKDKERLEEVDRVKTSAENIRTQQITQLEEEHKKQIDIVKQRVENETKKIYEREAVISHLQQKREQLYDELVKVHADYQDFINRHPKFDPGQTNYLLPDFRADPNVDNPYEDTLTSKYIK